MSRTRHIIQPGVLTAGLDRQMSIVADLEQHRQHLHRRITDRDTVPQESPNRSQDPIDSARAAYRWQSRTDTQSLRGARSVLEPGDERAQPLCCGPPVPLRPLAPPQIQRQRLGIGLRGALRAILAESQMPEILVDLTDEPVIVIDHGPIPLRRRQSHQKRLHRHPSNAGRYPSTRPYRGDAPTSQATCTTSQAIL